MKIKDLTKIERPREKLSKYGVDKLSNNELLAIILRTGTKKENAIELATKILKKFKANDLPQMSVNKLIVCYGLGPTKASEIVACFELGRRFLQNKQSVLILEPKDVWEEMKDVRGSKKEHFVVFYLDTRNQEIKREIISIGSLNSSLVHPREVFEPAVRQLAAKVIIAHNHPAGDPKPSECDSIMTQKLVEAGKLLDIEIIDHVVVTQKEFYSYREHKLI